MCDCKENTEVEHAAIAKPKRWCCKHFSAFYGDCPQCIQVEIRNLLKGVK